MRIPDNVGYKKKIIVIIVIIIVIIRSAEIWVLAALQLEGARS